MSTTSGCIHYERPSTYSLNTLEGNWVEEKCRYKKEKHNHISMYMQDYVPKPNSKLDPDIMWDRIFKGTGYGDRILFNHAGDKYINNFSTTYDLSYNHLAKEPPCRNWRFLADVWEPEQDFAKNFGNVTDYGITAYKNQIWESQKSDPRVTNTTEYEDSYLPPSDKDRQFKRWAIPSKNSSLLQPNNIISRNLYLRDVPTFNVTSNEELVVVPRERRCNPITWECYGTNPKESRRLAK